LFVILRCLIDLMKFVFACSFVVGNEAVSSDDWEAYKQKFGKVYNGGDDEYRHGVFEKNLAKYAALNAQEPLAHYGPTAFTDMTPDEYLSGYTPPTVEPPALEVDTNLEVTKHKDWTGVYTTPIKDQGACGSCWAESAIQQVESDAMREHNWTGVLSTQELVDCTTAGQGSRRIGCGGGNPTDGYDVIQAVGGVASGYDYKYTARDGTCDIDNHKKYVQIESYKSVGVKNEDVMKSYVSSTGTLSVCVDANDWGGYWDGIKTSCGTSIDHCVQIVGYGTYKGEAYWKVRNSWGSSWGENGYMRLKIGHDLCKISNGPTITSTSVVAPAPTPSPSTCTDQPSGWVDSEGDPCSLFELNSYCTKDGLQGEGWDSCSWGPITNYAGTGGLSAFDACCACGGGSAPTPTPPPAPTPSSTCSDISGWHDSEGSGCCVYSFSRYCTPDGGEGAGWDHASWGPITDYATKGVSGLDACCACGGGSKSVTV
jgi:hypothetical protein